jgi:hypothetical protein
MIGPRPVLPARGLISLTVIVLPRDTRDRYREEFRTELCELRTPAQIVQAAGILACSLQLRRALGDRDVVVTETMKRDWRCRIGRHSYVRRRDDNPEMYGRPYHHCVRCGERFEPDDEEQIDIETYARNNTPFMHGGMM